MLFLGSAGVYLVLLVWGIALAQRNAVQVPVESGAITYAFELALMITIAARKAFQDRNDHSVEAR